MLLWTLSSWNQPRPPELAPVMPEVDGIHPVVALVALDAGYARQGWLHKYPPLGQALFGLAVGAADPGLASDLAQAAGGELSDVVTAEADDVRALLWRQRDRLARALAAQRAVCFSATALAVALVAALACAVATRRGASAWVAVPVALAVAVLGWGRSFPVLYYATTANVDALCTAAGLAALCLAHGRRWLAAAVALGLAVAIKDPAFVLGPVALGAVAVGCGGRRAGLATAAALLVYGLAAGAFTGPATWWAHVSYLLSGGVEGVERAAGVSGRLALAGHAVGVLGEGLGLTLLALGGMGALGLLAGFRSGGGSDRAGVVVVLGGIAATWLLFVLPVGFVYPRFLLVPSALVAVAAAWVLTRGAQVAVTWCLSTTTPGVRGLRAAVVVAVALALLWLSSVGAAAVGLPAHVRSGREQLQAVLAGDDARRLAAEAAAALPPGTRVVLYADLRDHGPPLDPTALDLDVRGLGVLESDLAAWAAAPAEGRPEVVMILTFATRSPSGRNSPPPRGAQPGDELGPYVVREVFGRVPTGFVGRSVALQPTIAWLEPIR